MEAAGEEGEQDDAVAPDSHSSVMIHHQEDDDTGSQQGSVERTRTANNDETSDLVTSTTATRKVRNTLQRLSHNNYHSNNANATTVSLSNNNKYTNHRHRPKQHGDVIGLKNAAKRLNNSSTRPRRREFLNAAAAPSAYHPDQWQQSTKSSNDNNNNFNDSGINPMSASATSFFFKPQQKQHQYPPTMMTVEEQEEMVRSLQIKNPFALTILGFYAACKVMVWYLINMETILSCALTIGLTLYWYDIGRHSNGEWNGGGMDYVILAFAVTSPIAATIGMAFNRREMALLTIADFRSFASQLYMAHSLWDWSENGGRAKSDVDLRAHCDAVLAQIVGVSDELARFLTLPTTSRTIHRMTHVGRRQAAETVEVAYLLLQSMSHRMTRLCVYGERIKAAGLPSGELSRIRQYERFLEDCIERLRMIKMYRTPQAFRSFARIFTFLLPPFYAPTYAQVAIDVQNLGMGIAFGIITTLGLTALFESLNVLEDPFIGFLALDGIDVREEFQVLLWATLVGKRSDIFPDAPPYPVRRRRALTEGVHYADTRRKNDAPKPSDAPPSPPSVLAFGSRHSQRKSLGDDLSHGSSSLTDVAGIASRPGTVHGDTHETEFTDEILPTRISEAIEFGGLLDEEENLQNSAISGDSTVASYVRESNFKLHAPPGMRNRSTRALDGGGPPSRSPSRPAHRRNQTIA